jgi:transcriptional regulator with XRE-family HTH domain
MTQPHWKALVLLLKIIAEDKGITQQEIAMGTGIHQSAIARIFALRTCPTIDTFLKLAHTIGVNIFIEDKASTTELNVLFERAMEQLGRRPENLPKN